MGKYLRYAIGEIALVMIGILLALQVNNWNDKRKSQEAEAQYYCKLLEDFQLDKNQIEEVKESIDKSIHFSNEALLALDAGEQTRSEILNLYVSAIRRDIYVPRNKTFEELIYSGNLNVIKDARIKNALIQYNSDIESNLAVIKTNRDEFVKIVYELINSSIEFGIQEIDFVHTLLGPEVLEILPEDNWTKDKNSEMYINFQKALLFNLTTAAREKQVLDIVLDLSETPRDLLQAECNGI